MTGRPPVTPPMCLSCILGCGLNKELDTLGRVHTCRGVARTGQVGGVRERRGRRSEEGGRCGVKLEVQRAAVPGPAVPGQRWSQCVAVQDVLSPGLDTHTHTNIQKLIGLLLYHHTSRS